MNFDFSDDQQMLRDQAQGFLAEHGSLAVCRTVLENKEQHYSAELWLKMAELGWMATTIPEAYGGIGLGYLELCVIAEELGRVLAPIPFGSSVYLATEALLMAADEATKQAYLPKLASGETIGCFALAEGMGEANFSQLKTRCDSGKLYGTKIAVSYGICANIAVVAAADAAGSSWYLVELDQEGVSMHVQNSIDPTAPQTQIIFDGANCSLLGEAGQGEALTEKLFNRAAVLFAFEQVGASQTALDTAKEFAINRYAFGRPIATFQGIKHKLADMYVAVTLARSNCYYGAWALGEDAPELPLAAATARVSATKALHECAKENIQTHGGMGYTWEFDCQLFYRRSRILATNLGSLYRWKDKLVVALENNSEAAAKAASTSTTTAEAC